MSPEVEQRMSALAGTLTGRGLLADPGWRAAYWSVPRHLFVPPVIWAETDAGDYLPVGREDDGGLWWAAAYGDQYIVTQVDDGVPAGPDGRGRVSSSSASQPSHVFAMLDALDIVDGVPVEALEIGTGTGYNAGLMSARLGGDRVVSVEIDALLADGARASLKRACQAPAVVTGDGADGYAARAPYDRVLATAAVQRVPWAWVEQTRPGGLIVAPWGTAFCNNALLRLRVAEDGSASGRMIGGAPFMWVRQQRTPVIGVRDVVRDEDEPARSITEIEPAWTYEDDHAAFAVGVRVPNCQWLAFDDPEGSGEYTLWLLDAGSRSWASVDYEPGAPEFAVEECGPRRLWTEVERAYRWWVRSGRPDRERFGVTVAPGRQTVWLDEPENAVSGGRREP